MITGLSLDAGPSHLCYRKLVLGRPREALLVTVVLDNEDEGHAVLTVTTDKGDYVLDNKKEEILSNVARPFCAHLD